MRSVARFVSIAGHPFVLIPLCVGVAALRTLPNDKAAQVIGALLGSLAIFGGYVVVKVRQGVWTNVDVSVREQRPKMYLVAISATGASLAFLWLTGQPPPVLRGCAIALLLLILGAVVNRWIKASLHVAFGIYAAAIAAGVDPIAGAVVLLASAMVGWSRVVLGRHTRAEVLAGAILGVVASLATRL
jgi:membrane-associated phospholipid phosphatase